MFYNQQLQWIRGLQHVLRSPFLDPFFIAWDYVDSIYFSLFMIAVVWTLWDRRIGARFFYILILSFIANKLFKALFHQPRPCQIDPLVGILCKQSPGLPSGAAQTATIICGMVWLECKKPLYRALAIVFGLFLCFSRVYLGVHFPTDILAGIIIGAVLVWIYAKVFPLFGKVWKIAVLGFSLLFLCFAFLSISLPLFGLTFGVALGLLSYEKATPKEAKSVWIRGLQTLSSLVGIFLCFAIYDRIPHGPIFLGFVQGYWLSFLGAWIIKH
jgi:undecaprenyl-diphosphatase